MLLLFFGGGGGDAFNTQRLARARPRLESFLAPVQTKNRVMQEKLAALHAQLEDVRAQRAEALYVGCADTPLAPPPFDSSRAHTLTHAQVLAHAHTCSHTRRHFLFTLSQMLPRAHTRPFCVSLCARATVKSFNSVQQKLQAAERQL